MRPANARGCRCAGRVCAASKPAAPAAAPTPCLPAPAICSKNAAAAGGDCLLSVLQLVGT